MFALRVTYLMGRVYSAAFEDGDDKRKPEWPPHPSRFFSALVAAWGDSGAEEDLKPGLEWFGKQGAPTIYSGDCTPRKLVQAYVPTNDDLREHARQFSEQRKKGKEGGQLPDDRVRKSRTFPSASLSLPEVYFVWASTPPPGVLSAIARILERTSALGHSSSLVSVDIVDQVPDEQWTEWVPGAPAGLRMRIPYPERLEELIERYERFKRDPTKMNRPSRGKTTLYGPPSRAVTETPQGVFDRMIVLRRETGPRASLRSALSVVSAFRGALLKLAPQPVAECLSGHAPGSTAEVPLRSERPHVSLVALPFAGDPHASGDLMGVAALLPSSLTSQEHDLCWSVISQVKNLQMPWGQWEVSMTDAEENLRTLLAETWSRPQHVWSTVTPFVFDRYPKDPYGEEAERIVRDAFVRVGLPEPREVDLHYNPWHNAVPKAPAFPAAAARPGKPQRYHCHVLARWPEAIRGPIVAGAGRYYGYGLFRPLFEKGAQ